MSGIKMISWSDSFKLLLDHFYLHSKILGAVSTIEPPPLFILLCLSVSCLFVSLSCSFFLSVSSLFFICLFYLYHCDFVCLFISSVCLFHLCLSIWSYSFFLFVSYLSFGLFHIYFHVCSFDLYQFDFVCLSSHLCLCDL